MYFVSLTHLDEQYMKEGKEFKDPADAINHVYIQFLSQRENASLVFPIKKRLGNRS